MTDGVDAKAVVSTSLGDVEVPLDVEQWGDMMTAIADDDGWDVIVGLVDINPPLTAPRLVGAVIRVPGVADPDEAATIAMNLATDLVDAGTIPTPEGETRNMRLSVAPLNGFGE